MHSLPLLLPSLPPVSDDLGIKRLFNEPRLLPNEVYEASNTELLTQCIIKRHASVLNWS